MKQHGAVYQWQAFGGSVPLEIPKSGCTKSSKAVLFPPQAGIEAQLWNDNYCVV
jgi:hypothetical protein